MGKTQILMFPICICCDSSDVNRITSNVFVDILKMLKKKLHPLGSPISPKVGFLARLGVLLGLFSPPPVGDYLWAASLFPPGSSPVASWTSSSLFQDPPRPT